MAKILIVEDDPSLCLLYSSEFKDDGYEVRTAQSGDDAIKIVDGEPLDLVVLDIRMEPMDGLELLDHLMDRRKGTPVVINSAYPSFKADFSTWGADAYVVKSSDLTELKETVRNLLAPTAA
jgi:DNA-binding response OmpR family regulator